MKKIKMFQNIKRLSLALFLIANSFGSVVIWGQMAREESRQYRIQYDFQERTIYTYKMNYTTTVKRTFADNTTKNFERKVEVYLTFWRPSALSEGFAEIRTSLDSFNYEYKDENNSVRWSTQSNENPIPGNPDFDVVFPILGRSFFTTISPYFDVAKIEGKYLDEARDNIREMSDTTLRQIWLKANSNENLKFYADMNKSVLRSGRFAIDSAWNMRFTIPIEGIRYTCDTATVKFYLYDGKNFHIKAEMPKMMPNLNDNASVIGMNREILSVDSTSYSSGFWDISVSPRGMLNTAIGKFTTKTNSATSGNLKFSDEIITEIKYEMLGTQRWRD